jgi:sugar lactone lactonase YvrE
MLRLALLAVAPGLLALLPGATKPPTVHPVSVPRTAVVGTPWRASVRVSSAAPAVLEARSAETTLRARLVRGQRRGVVSASFRFPRAGAWTVAAVVRGRRTRLGSVAVDVPRDPLVRDPLALAVEPSGSLLVAQLREAPLLRVAGGRASVAATGVGAFHVSVADGRAYLAARDGAVYRLDGASLVRLTPPVDASSVAVDAAGNLYVTQYVGWVRRVAPDGTLTTVAGDGTEGYSGDGGPGTAAKIFHPHALAIGRDGALYVADTENRRIRRIDLGTGRITTFGGDVGITVSLAAAPDGSIWSADVVRNGVGGGVTRTAPDGTTRRVLASGFANGVAVAEDGMVYVNFWEEKRIRRLDPATRRLEPVVRG